MGKPRAKKPVKQPESSFKKNGNDEEAEDHDAELFPTEENVEREVAAIRAVLDVEIGRLVTQLHLLRSYLSKEELQTPLLAFFNETFPNLSISVSETNGEIEVKGKEEDNTLSMNPASGSDVHSYFLHQLSTIRPSCSTAVPSSSGFGFSGKSVKEDLSRVESMQVNNQKLTIAMTPKSVRLPKQGEILLSVNGSPVGVYRDNKTELQAIYESEEED